MKKINILLAALLFIAGCDESNKEDSKPYNLRLERIKAISEAYIGFPMNVRMTVSSDREAESVPYTLLLINKGDYDSGSEEPRYLSLGEFESIGPVKEGTYDYAIQAVIPDEDGQSGEYYLVGLIDPTGDVDGDGGKLENTEILTDPDSYDTVNLDPSHKDETDFSISEINLTSASTSDRSANDVFVIRDTDRVEAPVITGSVTVKTLGLNPQLNVPVAVYLMKETESGRELVPGKLWDSELQGYVNKYYIAELVPETPSVVHFSMSFPLGTRSYLKEAGTSALYLTVVVDPDNRFGEPTIADVVNGETNNMQKSYVTVVYDDAGAGSGGETTTEASIDTNTPVGQWFDKASVPTEMLGRTGAATVQVDDYIFVFGGMDSSGNVLDSILAYDIANDTWHDATAESESSDRLSIPRFGSAAVYCNGYIYVIGGRDAAGNTLNTIEGFAAYSYEGYTIWNCGVESMTLNHGRYGHTAVATDGPENGYIYVIGGVGAERSVEYIRTRMNEVPDIEEIGELPSLNQGRSFHGSEICFQTDAADSANDRALIVVAGGIQNGASTGSIETLDLERYDNPYYEEYPEYYEPSSYRPSATATWQASSARIETTLASMSTASLKLASDSAEQVMYLFGGQKVYNRTETSCPSGGDFALSDCTQTNRQASEPQSTVWRYNPFSDTLERVNALPHGPRAWGSMATYTDPNGNNYAYVIGGTDTGDGADAYDEPGAPSAADVPLSAACYGFEEEYDPDAPPTSATKANYPTERIHFQFENDMYGGKSDIVGAGLNYYFCSKFTLPGYKLDCQSGLVVDLFSKRFVPFSTDIRAYHYINTEYDDLLQVKIMLLEDPAVLFQDIGTDVKISLSDFKDVIAIAIKKNNMKNIAEELDKDPDKRKEPNLMNPEIFEYQCSLFEKLRVPTQHRIGPFFGLFIVLKWDAGFKAGWDFSIGFEKGTQTVLGVGDVDYNRAYIKPSTYGSVYGFLSAGVSAGSVLTLGIDADFDIIRIDIEVILANNFKLNSETDPALFATNRSVGWTGKLSLVKGGVTAYVEFMLPGICNKKKWGITWYYPCLKRERKTLPWPNITFCAYAITLWDMHYAFGDFADWEQYDGTINLDNDPDIRPGFELLENSNELYWGF
ncbi:MAG TPA: kelch repeat-containing protein [Spirochaetota bacterium]|nr:kelch repeat-containing protein [Spirochaetota bacterium]